MKLKVLKMKLKVGSSKPFIIFVNVFKIPKSEIRSNTKIKIPLLHMLITIYFICFKDGFENGIKNTS